MTILDTYKFKCYEVLNCGVKYGLIILQPPRSYSARPAAAVSFRPWHFSRISSKSASQMAPSGPLIDFTDEGKVFSVRKPARAILRLRDASTHQKPAIFGGICARLSALDGWWDWSGKSLLYPNYSFAPCLRSSSIISVWPPSLARDRGVLPYQSLVSTLAPWARSISACVFLPPKAA